MGRSTGGKKYQTSRVATTEARIPSHRPPIQALRNTAGQKRNHSKGRMIGHIIHCTRKIKKTGARARRAWLNLNCAPTPIPLVEDDRFLLTISPACEFFIQE